MQELRDMKAKYRFVGNLRNLLVDLVIIMISANGIPGALVIFEIQKVHHETDALIKCVHLISLEIIFYLLQDRVYFNLERFQVFRTRSECAQVIDADDVV